MQQSKRAPRLLYGVAAVCCVALGLATRPLKRVADAPASALGDALYAVLIYLLLVLTFPRLPTRTTLLLAVAVCWMVEISQLWHVGWLDIFRHTTTGALTIGGTFSFEDMACYAVGAGAAFCGEIWLQRRLPRAHTV